MFYKSAFGIGRSLFQALQRNQKRIALTALPIFLFTQQVSQKYMAQEAQKESSGNINKAIEGGNKKINTPRIDTSGNFNLCHKDDLKNGDIKLFTVGEQKILLAKIEGQYYACDALSPVDNKSLLDSTLLIGDKIYDITNGAIFSIKEGTTEYSPNLEQLKVLKVITNEDKTISVRYTNEKPAFDTVNMRGWVPDFTNLVFLGSGIESINIIRTLRQAKYRGLITLMFGEDIESPYDSNLLYEDLENINNPPVRDKEFYDQFQVKIAKNKENVKYINIDEQIIKTTVGKEDSVPYQKLVYAMGVRPRFHGIFGLGLQGIYQPCQLSDFKKVKNDSINFKKVVIVGDCLNSIRMSNNLKKNTKAEITLVIEEDNILQDMKLGEEVQNKIIQELKKNGIQVIKNAPITGAFGNNKNVEKVSLQNGKELPCDALFLMRQEFPNINACESNMRLCEDGALYTDSYQRTVSQNIWSVGPTASIISPFIAKRMNYTNSGDILLQAHTTALNLLDKRLALRSIPFDKLKIGNLQLNKIGYPCQSNRHVVDGDIESNDYMIYYFRDDQLIGAATANRYKDLAIVREALFQDIVPRGQMNINPAELHQNILQLKPKKQFSEFMAGMRKRPHMTK